MFNSQKGRIISIVLILFLGSVLSGAVSRWVWHWERQRLLFEFKVRAHDRGMVLKDAFQDHLDAAHRVVDFFNSSEMVEWDEFSSFTHGFLGDHPDILALDWIPRVDQSERGAFEEKGRREIGPNFEIRERNSQNNLVAAGPRPEYFPIYYEEPKGVHQVILGYDEFSESERRTALDKARKTGLPTATGGIKLIRINSEALGCRVFFPVYQKGVDRTSAAHRYQGIQGFVSILFNIGQVAEAVIEKTAIVGIPFSIIDEGGSFGRPLYHHVARTEKKALAQGRQAVKKHPADFVYEDFIQLADRRWTVICQADPEFWFSKTNWQPWIVLGTGLFLTLLLVFYILALTGREAEIRRVVDLRTSELRQATEEWQKTFDAITDLIFIQDSNHVIQKANIGFAKSIKKELPEVIGKKCYELMHGTDAPWPTCPFEATKKDKKTHTVEVNDPNIGVPLLVTTCPIFDDQGQLTGSVHIAKDITEFKKAQEQLRKAAEMKISFTSMVSHELRTPLTAIKEGISILIDGVAGEVRPEQREFLDIAKRNVDRLSRLIHNVLDFQKLDAGRMEFFMKPNDINAAVQEVHQTMASLAHKKGLSLTLQLDPTLPQVKFDQDKILQVIVNLVNNALKFTERGGITLATSRKEESVEVAVRDTGPGIRAEDSNRLFREYEQLESMLERKTGGTGLGLAICRQIIEHHNGKIWVESQFGHGAAFHFTLPI